jgi:hypothetical protein
VYFGPDRTFTDAGVTAGKTYTYSLSALDPAANSVTTSLDVTAKRPDAPRLHWPRVKGADYYNVQLFRGNRKILSRWPHRNSYQLRRTWTFRGKKRVLKAGSYRWYVWPGYGRRSQRRYGKLSARRRLEVSPAQAARVR